jgi:YHS domain-containing protein
MELAESEVGASLTTGGNEHAFCSDECLRRFVAAPEKYAGAEA